MPDLKNILVNTPIQDRHKSVLQQAAPGASFAFIPGEDITEPGQLTGYDAIIGYIPPSWLPATDRLRWLHLESAGAGGYHESGLFPPEAVLTCSTGAYGQSVAEHAFAMLLALQKNLHRYRDNQGRSVWRGEGPVLSPAGQTALIVGLGDIGGCFAGLMKAVGAYTIGVRRTSRPSSVVDECHPISRLDELLPRADVILLSLPHTADTAGLIGASRLARMKPTAILLNVGRGTAVDSDALCAAVERGDLRGAGLDVTDPEPIPEDHCIWRAKNILLTPHIAGGFHLAATVDRIVQIAAQNLKLLTEGKTPVNLVPPTLGYADPDTKVAVD